MKPLDLSGGFLIPKNRKPVNPWQSPTSAPDEKTPAILFEAIFFVDKIEKKV